MHSKIPPPANWRSDLKGTARAWEWRRASGLNADGSAKAVNVHSNARERILRKERLRVIGLKDESELKPEDHIVLEKEKRWKSIANCNKQKRRDIPEVRLKQNAQKNTCNLKRRKNKMDNVAKFISDKQLDIDTAVLSDKDAFEYILELMDDKTSPLGKDIFDALGGMTLRTAFWYGEFNGTIYALTSRGAGDFGGSASEYIRFLVNNCMYTTVLTHPCGEPFKYSEPEFKDLQATYVPLRVCNTYANCTTMESAFQLLFDFLELGRHRLWLRSGTGYSKLALRKCDMKYIEDSGDKNPKFMFGITILKNVSVLDRTIDCNGNDIVSYTSGGLGTTCKVNKSLSHTFLCNESQEKALVEALAMLPPNFMAAEACRKRKAEFMEDSVMRW